MALALAPAASSVIIDSDDGNGNTEAPVPDDPGWSNVGTIGGLSGVYLGGRFVLTAYHVGPGNITLGNTTYRYVPGTAVQLDNGDVPLTYADLLMFQIYPEPPLPQLAIASLPPAPTTPVIMIGHGSNRGPATTWNPDPDDPSCPPSPPNPPPPDGPVGGYEWGSGNTMRWGTNTVESLPFEIEYPPLNTFTMAFPTDFDAPGLTQTEHEAQAAVGDSGGATFASNGTQWELAGTLFLIGLHSCQAQQAPNTALYGNATYSVDLSSYRDQILDVMATPEPRGGLWPGAALALLLTRRRRARPATPVHRVR